MSLTKSDIILAILNEKYEDIKYELDHNNNILLFVLCNEEIKGDKFISCINDQDECCEFCTGTEEVTLFFKYPDCVIPRVKKIKFFQFWLEYMRNCQCDNFCRSCRKIIRQIQEDIKYS